MADKPQDKTRPTRPTPSSGGIALSPNGSTAPDYAPNPMLDAMNPMMSKAPTGDPAMRDASRMYAANTLLDDMNPYSRNGGSSRLTPPNLYSDNPLLSAMAPPYAAASRNIDPQASLRAELLGQIMAAKFDLEATIAELVASNAATDCARSNLQALNDLLKQVGTASGMSLQMLRGDVAASTAAARTVVQQGRAAATDPADRPMTRAEARTAIAEVGRDVFGRKVFDPYLQFSSPEEERAYREREAKRQQEYERERAKGTPEGDRRAATILRNQLDDAKAHGADASPDFAPIDAKLDRARAAVSSPERPVASLPGANKENAPPSPDTPADVADALAALRAAGVITPSAEHTAAGHGLTAKHAAVTTDRSSGAGRFA